MWWRALRSGRLGMEGGVEPLLDAAFRCWAGLAARQTQAPGGSWILEVFWDDGCPRDHQMTAATQTLSSYPRYRFSSPIPASWLCRLQSHSGTPSPGAMMPSTTHQPLSTHPPVQQSPFLLTCPPSSNSLASATAQILRNPSMHGGRLWKVYCLPVCQLSTL